jgi:Mg-chelatase subunit ChlD
MKPQTLVTSITLALLGSAAAQASTAADLYKWVDDKGQVHYTSSPPPETAKKPQQIDPANPTHVTPLAAPAASANVAPTPASDSPAPAQVALVNTPAGGASVLFVLDGSGSMWAKLGDKSRIDVAKTVMADMLNKVGPEVHAGLLVYGTQRKDDCNDIEMLAPMGSSRATLVQALNSVNPKGMTPLTGAIQLAAAQLKQVEGAASVVVVSDGKETCAGDPCAAAREAANAGVNLRIHVVGLDVAPDETQQLNCIAKEGKGKYFAANNAEQLVTALAEVRKEVVAPPPPPPAPVKVAQISPPPPQPTEVLFEDHFDRNELGEMWEIVKPDPNRLVLSDSKLLIAAAKLPASVKDKSGFTLTTPANLALLQKSPSGNFVATVKVTSIDTIGMRVGLYYWVDENNFVVIGLWMRREYLKDIADYENVHVGSIWRRPTFSKLISRNKDEILLKADKIGNRDLKDELPKPEAWYFQLERVGVKYIGRVSLDGNQWEEIGTHIFIPKSGRIGLGTYQDWNDGNEQPVEFEDFIVKGAR